MHCDLTQERLKELLIYNPETGEFFWRVRAGSAAAGRRADCKASQGYVRIRVDGVSYLAHRLAWLYCKGQFPEGTIDHKNRIRSDNRIANLRDVSHRENHENKSMHSNNTSGVQGVYWCKRSERWIASIKINYKNKHIGAFLSIEEAAKARAEAKEKLHRSA